MSGDMKQHDLTNFDCKQDSSLTRFDGKVQLIGSDKTFRETLPLILGVQKLSSCFLNSFSGGSIGAAESNLLPDLVNSSHLKDYMCTFNLLCHLAKISNFQHISSQTTYRVTDAIMILFDQRSANCVYSRGDPGMQPTGVQQTSMGPGLPTV